ncbi:MAG: hypothetical protein ACO20L_07130, partial [Candidatus Puniceispirillaceae bacterium]
MRPYTKSHIRQIMSGLMKTKHHLLDTYIVELAASRWMMPVNERSIIQIELLHHRDQALLSSTVARDGSGPLKASFLTMLLLEDTIAHAQRPFGICSGAATITLHRFLDIAAITDDQMAVAISRRGQKTINAHNPKGPGPFSQPQTRSTANRFKSASLTIRKQAA